ncbi:MAG: DUF177 domain-containing protein [Alphaproteobacteria bacterium]|nr:DUF177 domain-containing protein [Alphaproteobacteria bacterium]
MSGTEFSRPLRVSAVPAPGQRLVLEASAEECAALAARFGILSVAGLRAEMVLRPDAAGGIAVDGTLSARVVQACVVSLEPVAQVARDEFAFRILPEGAEPTEDLEGEDEVELENGIAELGEVVAQYLSLALDPYPRAEGAELPDAARDDSANPFAALRGMNKE